MNAESNKERFLSEGQRISQNAVACVSLARTLSQGRPKRPDILGKHF